MSLLFGRLTQNFVTFAQILNGGDEADLPKAAADFRRASALNASYLTYIGEGQIFTLIAL